MVLGFHLGFSIHLCSLSFLGIDSYFFSCLFLCKKTVDIKHYSLYNEYIRYRKEVITMTKQSREIIRRKRAEHRQRYIELTTFGWTSTMMLMALSYLCDSGWCNFWTLLACGAGAFSIIMTGNYDF